MEVDNTTYQRKLITILDSLANSLFVSIDLEMSGISLPRERSRASRGLKPDLQAHYEEVARGAESFQVLQLGITIVEADKEREFYLTRPFNLFVSPLSDENNTIRLERNFTFSSSACGFLSKNCFDFGKVFTHGVTYLSREEETQLRSEFLSRGEDHATARDIVAEGQLTLDFVEEARKSISNWLNAPLPKFEFVNIASKDGPLNGYQRLLLFQLVRTEFPGLRIFVPRKDCGFMQVVEVIPAQEEARKKHYLGNFNRKLKKQKGLSYIFEALAGGDLSDLDPTWFYNPKSKNLEDFSPDQIKSQLESIKKKLKSKKIILVGHNLFTDLTFIYTTFIGKLPEKVQDFQKAIHEMFPVVFDTKYLASHGASDMDPRGNLKDLLQPFKDIHVPLVVLHEDYNVYSSSLNKEHEAGFDSWMTAELFVKLSAKLYAKRLTSEPTLQDELPDTEDEAARSDDLQDAIQSQDPNNPYSLLSIESMEEETTEDFRDGTEDSETKGSAQKTNFRRDEGPTQWIPPIESQFWHLYINKLRINAIESGVCDLAETFDENEDQPSDSEYFSCEEESHCIVL